MAYRLKFSARALREKSGTNYRAPASVLNLLELQLKQLEQAPLLYSEIIPNVRRALLPRFPYGLFYVVRSNFVHIFAVLHDARNPGCWPKKL